MTTEIERYIARGWHVLPVRPNSKEPATLHGVKDATVEPGDWNGYNVGVACGHVSGIFVVDVDPRNGGSYTPQGATATVATPSGGTHYYYRLPDSVSRLRKTLSVGVDIQGDGKYVVAPPSTINGNEYKWLTDCEPAEAPQELMAQIALLDTSIGTRPGDRFNATHTWEELLTPLGWRVDHKDGGHTYWTRPGKDAGVSASTNYEDSDLLWVFSSSTGLEPDKSYDKFAFYTYTEYNGDFSEAAKSLSSDPPLSFNPTRIVLPEFVKEKEGKVIYTPIVPPNNFIAEYVAYGAEVTDARAEYQEAAALSLLSVVSGGMKIALAPYPGGLATNLYLTLVGSSSVSRKSTVQSLARSIIAEVRPNALLPDRMTGEAAINELSQRTAALWLPDEFGMMVQQMYQRDFLRPLEELLLTLYSGQEYRYSTVSGGEHVISGVHLGVFGATTPDSLAGAGHRAIGSGLLPRFGIVFPDTGGSLRPPKPITDGMAQRRQALVYKLRSVLVFCAKPNADHNVTFSLGALEQFIPLDAEISHNPMTARLITSAYKVAALIAIADMRTNVNGDDALAATVIVRRWAEGADHLREYIARPSSDVAFMELVNATRRTISRLPGVTVNGRLAVSLRDIAVAMRLERRTLNRIRDTLEATGEVLVRRENGEEDWLCLI